MTKPMFASIRKYNEAPAFADDLAQRQEEIKAVLRPIHGLQAFYLVKTHDGVVSMTICDNRESAEESNRVAAGWLKDKLPAFSTRPPEVTTGEVRFHLNSDQPAPTVTATV